MNTNNIITDKEKFTDIMRSLNGSITDVFIRVSTQKNAGIFDSDLVNMNLSDDPITISYRDDGNINIFDSGDNNFIIEMEDFQYADITNMNEKSTFGFLRTECNAISVWLNNGKFIVLYYWTDENEENTDTKSELHFAADFIMEYLPDNLKSKLTKNDIITILELETDYCALRDIESESACGC